MCGRFLCLLYRSFRLTFHRIFRPEMLRPLGLSLTSQVGKQDGFGGTTPESLIAKPLTNRVETVETLKRKQDCLPTMAFSGVNL